MYLMSLSNKCNEYPPYKCNEYPPIEETFKMYCNF